MASRFETVPFGNGLRITKIVSTDVETIIPNKIDGKEVMSLGDRVLQASGNSGSKILVIPASVIEISSELLSGTSGIRKLVYLGSFTTFGNFKIIPESECELFCAEDEVSFVFPGNFPMAFPDFDDKIMESAYNLNVEISIKRISEPVGLTEINRKKYLDYLKTRMGPLAERAVTSNDMESLSNIISAKILSYDEIKPLLELSLKSGKTVTTSFLMSVLYDMKTKRLQ